MSKYQEFQQKMKNVSAICGYSSKDVAALKYQQLLEEVLEELKKLEDNPRLLKSDREGIQDWDGGERDYQAYLEEFGVEDEEVTDDDDY